MVVLFLFLMQSEKPLVLDLATTVTTVLDQNPILQAAYEKRVEVDGGVKEARSQAFPDVTLVSNYTRSRNPGFLNSKDLEDIVAQFPEGDFTPQPQGLYKFAVDVHQSVFTWGRIRSAIALAGIVRDLTETEIRQAQLDLGREAALAYFQALYAEARLRVQQDEVAVRQAALDTVETRMELGEATMLEYLRSKSAVAEIGPSLTQAEADLDLSRRALRRILGLSNGRPLDVTPIDGALPACPDLKPLLRLASAHRPELQGLQFQQQSLRKQEVIEAAAGKPQVDFNASAGRESLYLENLNERLYDSWYATLELSWNVFDGGRRKAKVAQLASQRRQAEWQERDLVQQVEFEVKQALSSYRAALGSLAAAQTRLETAEEAERVAQVSYTEGEALHTDFLDAQQDAREARLAFLDAQLNGWRQAADLARSIGFLPHEAWSPDGLSASSTPMKKEP